MSSKRASYIAYIEIAEQRLSSSRLKFENIKKRIDAAGVHQPIDYSELLKKSVAQAEHHLHTAESRLERMKANEDDCDEMARWAFDRCRDDFAASIKNVVARFC